MNNIFSEVKKENKKGIATLSSSTLSNSWRKNNQKKSVHSLHTIASRTGSFPPALARYFILNYSKKNDVVLDPYCGKGTVPLEAIINNRRGIGSDVAPDAYILTHAKIHNVTHGEFLNYISKINLDDKQVIYKTPADVKIFFSEKTLNQILFLKEVLKNKNGRVHNYAKAILIGILHGGSDISLSLQCSHSFSMSPNYVKKYAKKHKLLRPHRDVIDCMLKKSEVIQKDGTPVVKGVAMKQNAEDLNKIESNSIDLIVTSPPYLHVQTYAWDNWLRLWFLGHNHKDVRKNMIQTHNLQKYREHIKKSISEMLRVIKPRHYVFIVVGDVRKYKNNGPEKLIKLAYEIADVVKEIKIDRYRFEIEGIINDPLVLHRRYNSSYLEDGKGVKRDRILCLYKTK